MNSDPYDSAAWRTFGMLDADESAIFDEAMRHDPLLRGAYLEMDRLSAAIAATTTVPIPPRAGQLERLRNRLGLEPAASRSPWWFGISGWAAAAALALFMVLRSPGPEPSGVVKTTGPDKSTGPANATPPAMPGSAAANGSPAASAGGALAASGTPAAADHSNDSAVAPPAQAPAAGGATKAETRRLVQEIAVLRENLEKFQRRDRILFDAVPGIALPVVMTMAPPGKEKDDELSPTLVASDGDSTITALLGDALAAMTRNQGAPLKEGLEEPLEGIGVANVSQPDGTALGAPPLVGDAALPVPPELPALGSVEPSAIPIYDMARDSGTLVVNNLPQITEDETYNLWVTTETSTAPIYVGSLPQATGDGAESFDFSLGSTTVLPSGFVLTKDSRDTPQRPSESNTVLQGPPVPER